MESFNGRFRDECLSQNQFPNLARARVDIETWRVDYNTKRPHSSLGYLTPEEFKAAAGARSDDPTCSLPGVLLGVPMGSSASEAIPADNAGLVI